MARSFVFKASDTALVPTTYTNDPELAVPLTANTPCLFRLQALLDAYSSVARNIDFNLYTADATITDAVALFYRGPPLLPSSLWGNTGAFISPRGGTTFLTNGTSGHLLATSATLTMRKIYNGSVGILVGASGGTLNVRHRLNTTHSAYPSVLRGSYCELITADSDDLLVIKPSDTSRASTVTVTDDPHLVLTGLAANAIYEVDIGTLCDTEVVRVKLGFTGTVADTIGVIAGVGPTTTSSGNSSSEDAKRFTGTGPFDTEVTMAGVYSSGYYSGFQHRFFLTTGGTGGNLSLKWAQGVSSATACRVRAGSWIYARRLETTCI